MPSKPPNLTIWFLFLLFALKANCSGQGTAFPDSVFSCLSKQDYTSFLAGTRLSAIHFSKAENNRINLGKTADQYGYVVLKLSGPALPPDGYLLIDNTSLDSIAIFQLFPGGNTRLLHLGGTLVDNGNEPKYVWHTAPVAASDGPVYLFLAMKAVAKNINISYYLLTRNELDQRVRNLDRLVFYYIGTVSLIAITALLMAIIFRNASMMAYVGYILFFACWILCHYGYLHPLLYPHFPRWNEVTKPVFSLGACLCLAIVFRLLFREELKARRWLAYLLKAISFLLPLGILSMLLMLAPGIDLRIRTFLVTVWHIDIVAALPILVITPVCFYRSGVPAKIFSLAALVSCIMVVVQLFSNFGYINNYFINEHGMTMASIIEILIMAFGLFYNHLLEKQQKEGQVLALEQKNSETLKRLIMVQDNERKRIAGDLHDNIGPLLAALKINFRQMSNPSEKSRLADLSAKTEYIIDDSLAEIRNIAHNLMPKSLLSKGLINTLSEYFDSVRLLYHKEIRFQHEVRLLLGPDLQINLYRIICEGVLNAAKHSDASVIGVDVRTTHNCILLCIEDNGRGLPENPTKTTPGLGLQNMEDRLSYLKGIYSLQSTPGKGTHISMEIPVTI